MTMTRILTTAILALTLLSSCGQNIEPIEYGKDNCHWCQMRIMDPRFGAEAITEKGRKYKFDSAECLLDYLKESDNEHRHLLVTDHEAPETLIDASAASYLVSQKMPSPMGGFLNAFKDKSTANSFRERAGGEVFDWQGIQAKYTK